MTNHRNLPFTNENINTESFIYYARQQTAVARGLAWLARRPSVAERIK